MNRLRLGDFLARRLRARSLALLAVSVLVIVLVVLPLASLLLDAVTTIEQGRRVATAGPLLTVLGGSIYWTALANTVLVAGIATIVAVVLGVCLGWLFGRSDMRGAKFLEELAAMPIFIPPFVGALAWTLLAAPRIGLLNVGMKWLGLPLTIDVYTLTGMGWVIGIYLTPYVMMTVAGALRSMDPSLEEAGRIAGLGSLRATVTITLPLVLPAILAGAVLSFSIAIGLFGTPVVLGWSKQILLLTSRIWIGSQAVPPQHGEMAVLALYLVVLSVGASMLQRRLLSNRAYVTVTGKGFKPRQVPLGRVAPLAFGFVAAYLMLTVVAPVGVLVAALFSTYPWSGTPTLANVAAIAQSNDAWATLKNSVVLSVTAATLALALGFQVAWIASRTRLPGRRILESLVLLPVSVPGIAFGVGVMLLWLKVPLPVYATAWIIILAFVGRYTAYAVQPVSASLRQLHPELEESARVAGLGWWQTFRTVTMPLVKPSAIAGWILLLSIFMTELSMVILLYTAATRTFSVLTFETWNNGELSLLAGLSILQLIVGASIMALVRGVLGQPTSARAGS